MTATDFSWYVYKMVGFLLLFCLFTRATIKIIYLINDGKITGIFTI